MPGEVCAQGTGRPAAVLMIKAPRAGSVKTRLCPPLDPREAADLAAAMARDCTELVLRVVPEVIAAFSPEEAGPELEALLPGIRHWAPQPPGDLGRRQERALATGFGLGCAPILVLGTDSPTLPTGLIESARRRLESGEADLVLGPSHDGGYYLLGVRRPVSGLLDGVPWSTGEVFDAVTANAERIGLRVLVLPAWYDVDTPSDLSRLAEELLSDPAARERAPCTLQWAVAHLDRVKEHFRT